MRSPIYKILLIVLISTAAGCAGRVVHMQDEQGRKATCEVSTGSAMMTGVLMRDASIKRCVKNKRQAGFKVVSEE